MSRAKGPEPKARELQLELDLATAWNRAEKAEKELATALNRAEDAEKSKAHLRDYILSRETVDADQSKEVARLQLECDKWRKQALEKTAVDHTSENFMRQFTDTCMLLQQERHLTEKLRKVIALLIDLDSEPHPFSFGAASSRMGFTETVLDKIVDEAGLGSLGK